MKMLDFNMQVCDRCGICAEKCPFDALEMTDRGPQTNEKCRMCGVCVRTCQKKAIRITVEKNEINKKEWNDFLIFAEQERGQIHPVIYELIGEAQRMADKVGYSVKCVILGGTGTKENAEELLKYGISEVYVYEDEALENFRSDCYTEVIADCIDQIKPSSVLIGATSLGRSLAPRLAVKFKTGLTADCTTLDIMANSDLIQIRPAFGGNIMAQILISETRPQFATVRYRVMDKAVKITQPDGKIIERNVTDDMLRSDIEVISAKLLEKSTAIEEAEIIVAVGRGVKNEEGLQMCRDLAEGLGGTLAFTRPMVEKGIGSQLLQIGLSGHTVRPKLIITCGVSGAIQFTSCMNQAETIVAINSDPDAQIFNTANYCIVDDLYEIVPKLTELIRQGKNKNRK